MNKKFIIISEFQEKLKKFIFFSFLFLIIILSFISNPIYAAEEEQGRTVRVAYPVQPGLTDIDSQGGYRGYTYEYLEEIAQYTGWKYEFVQAEGNFDDSVDKLIEMVQKGEIDLIGGILYSEELGEQFDYCASSYGTEETVLQIPYEREENAGPESAPADKMRVAVLLQQRLMRGELEAYCERNDITAEYVLCGTLEDQLRAIREDRADALLNSSLNYVEGVQTVARFAQKPFYFVTGKNNSGNLMRELNSALLNIAQTNPNFASTLYTKYFSPQDSVLHLNRADEEYIREAGTLNVGMLVREPPFQYYDEKSGRLKGIAVDLLYYISEKTGLKFRFVGVDTPKQLYSMAKEGTVDLVAGIPYDYTLSDMEDLMLTRPYLSSQYILLLNQQISEESIAGKNLALVDMSTYHGKFVGKVAYYDSADACIRAVNSGEADYTYVDGYMAQYYINLPEFRGLKLVPQARESRKVCFGVSRSVGSRQLLDILNKTMATITEEEFQAVVYRNTVHGQELSLGYLIQAKPLETVAAVSGILLFIIGLLLFILRQRTAMNRKTALELKKHLRVYGLVNDYFFEYDYSKNTMSVFIPRADSKEEAELMQYDFNTPAGGEEARRARESLLELLRGQRDGVGDLRLLCTDGKPHWLRLALGNVYHEDGRPAYCVGKIKIIDEEREEKELLVERAQRDSLTQIFNTAACRAKITELLSALEQGQHGGLFLVDIDYFKKVNDTYGHLRGDWVLNETARALKNCFRPEDIIGRPGGDEFIAYIGLMQDEAAVAAKCETLCRKIREIPVSGGSYLTVSVGAALTEAGQSYDEAYRLADQALYRVKEKGRDGYVVGSPRG